MKWETTTTRNFGVEFGFMRNRFNGSVDLYWNTTDDLLMRTAIPTNTGYTNQYRNFGQTSNKGVEFAFDAALIEKKNFNMNFNFNVAYNRGKIESLNGMSGYFESSNAWSSNDRGCTNDFWLEEGGRIGEVWGYKYDGV